MIGENGLGTRRQINLNCRDEWNFLTAATP